LLPDSETCRKHLVAYKQRIARSGPNIMSFPRFWEYKIHCEKNDSSILDDANIVRTAEYAHALMIYLNRRKNSIVKTSKIETILRVMRRDYYDISALKLGEGKIIRFRRQLESIYDYLNLINENQDDTVNKSSIVGKSVLLMAIWGQTPRFDSFNRRRFDRWTHTPPPEKLPHLKVDKIWYQPDEFADIVEELDRWVMKWPESNQGCSFLESFYDLCPGIPPGRQIDIIYHWKMPDPRVDYRLASRGS
jgi:hypothetical protein